MQRKHSWLDFEGKKYVAIRQLIWLDWILKKKKHCFNPPQPHLHPPGSQEAVASLGFPPQSCIPSSQVNSTVSEGSLACNRMVSIVILAILKDILETGLSKIVFTVLCYLFQVRTTILKMVTKLTKSGPGGITGIDCRGSILSVVSQMVLLWFLLICSVQPSSVTWSIHLWLKIYYQWAVLHSR